MLTYASKFIYIAHAYVCMVRIYKKNVFSHLKVQKKEYMHLTPLDGTSIFQSFFHTSFIYLWYSCNNVIYCSYDTCNTYCQMGANCTYGHVGQMVHMGHVGHVVVFVHMVHVLHVLRTWMRNVGHLL
jgi:hypothetical protein